jgi:hypothetical protein
MFFRLRRARIAALAALMLSGCGTSTTSTDAAAPDDASNDVKPSDAASDAGACGESRIDYTIQYPGEPPLSACAGLPVVGVVVDYVRNDGGPCTIADTRAVTTTGGDGIVVQAFSRELFATAGTSAVTVSLQTLDLTRCGDAGPCGFGNANCSFQVTLPGTVGASVVEGELASPCTLTYAPSASQQQPFTVQMLALKVHGPVVANTNDPSNPTQPVPCP